jgi:hypothetical protein
VAAEVGYPSHQRLTIKVGAEQGQSEGGCHPGSDGPQGRVHGGEGGFGRLGDQRQPAGGADRRHRADVFAPGEREAPGFEATSEPGLHQRQVAKVFLARSRTGIRVRHDLAQAIENDRQHGGRLAEFGNVVRQSFEVDFAHQRPALWRRQRGLAAQRHGGGDDDLAALRQIAVRPAHGAGRPHRPDKAARREIESQQLAATLPPFQWQADIDDPCIGIEDVERVEWRERVGQGIDDDASALGRGAGLGFDLGSHSFQCRRRFAQEIVDLPR